MLLAIPPTRGEVTHHDDHVAGDHLLHLFVGGPVALYVAEVAPSLIRNAQRLYQGLHGVGEGVLIQHLEIFGNKPATLPGNPLPLPLASGGWA